MTAYTDYKVGDSVKVIDAQPRTYADEDYKNGDIFEVVSVWTVPEDIDKPRGVTVTDGNDKVYEMYVEEVRPYPITKEYLHAISTDVPADISFETMEEVVEGVTHDAVEHPNHYTQGKFEVIEIIEEITQGYSDDGYVAYCVGNALKYIARAPFKHENPTDDIRKAVTYLNFALERISSR